MELSRQGVGQHWANHSDKTLAAFLSEMQGKEDWTLKDLSAVEGHLITLGEAIESPEFCARLANEKPENTIELLSWLGSSVAFAILERVDAGDATALPSLLECAKENSGNPLFSIFVDRLSALSKGRLLSQVFAPQRMLLIEAAVLSAKALQESKRETF